MDENYGICIFGSFKGMPLWVEIVLRLLSKNTGSSMYKDACAKNYWLSPRTTLVFQLNQSVYSYRGISAMGKWYYLYTDMDYRWRVSFLLSVSDHGWIYPWDNGVSSRGNSWDILLYLSIIQTGGSNMPVHDMSRYFLNEASHCTWPKIGIQRIIHKQRK